MRKFLLIIAVVFLGAAPAACSSANHKAAAPATTTAATLDPTAQTKVCSALTDLGKVITNVGTPPAAWKASSATLKQVAVTMAANAPAQLATSAKSFAAVLTSSADKIAVATTTSQAKGETVTMVFAPKGQGQKYSDWLKQSCPSSN